LVILSDHRAGSPNTAANAIMLVRLDDNSSTVNVLSVPQDLRVHLPDGPAKLNAAYAQGGPNLLIRTLKTQVFPGLVVNHILDVDAGGFEDLVNTIGCVYTDVDHRYFNNNAQTESIDLQPGYQKLCGSQALEFVRFRDADSDSVRDARIEGFLSWAKDQLSPSQLLSGEASLLREFGAHVQTDHALHTPSGLLDLFDLAINSSAQQTYEVPFPGVFGACTGKPQTACHITATRQAEASTYRLLITPTAIPSTSRPAAASITDAGLVADREGE
jgi:LCP family protein required for cell wall assembly